MENKEITTAEGIRAIRTRMGMTQEQFAELIAVTKNTVYSWESGRRRPSKTAKKIIVEEYEKNIEENRRVKRK